MEMLQNSDIKRLLGSLEQCEARKISPKSPNDPPRDEGFKKRKKHKHALRGWEMGRWEGVSSADLQGLGSTCLGLLFQRECQTSAGWSPTPVGIVPWSGRGRQPKCVYTVE